MILFSIVFPIAFSIHLTGCVSKKMLSCANKCEKESLVMGSGPDDCYSACRITEGVW